LNLFEIRTIFKTINRLAHLLCFFQGTLSEREEDATQYR
jgi:hypothetical protein